MQTILYILMFFIGIYFGSFFTLAIYRIPKGENITYKHSYCPSCNHKLGILDLVPVFSYIFLGGKCRYCKKPIKIRYLLLEILAGLVFVLFTISLNIDIKEFKTNELVYLVLGILYFASLFIISGIDKEKRIIQKSVLIYGISIAILYMIYSCILDRNNVYGYVIYLLVMLVLFATDTLLLKKNLKYNYIIQLLILTVYMIIFSKVYVIIITIMLVILSIGFESIILKFKITKSKVKYEKYNKKPIAFFMCVSNMIAIIMTNIITNYMIN